MKRNLPICNSVHTHLVLLLTFFVKICRLSKIGDKLAKMQYESGEKSNLGKEGKRERGKKWVEIKDGRWRKDANAEITNRIPS